MRNPFLPSVYGFVLLSFATTVNAASMSTVWSSSSGTSGYGNLNGINITAVTSDTSPFIGLELNRFVAAPSGGWNAPGYELGFNDSAIVAAEVNANDFQQFVFDTAFSGYLYIENFDSSSVANVTATGATSLSLLTASSSVTYASTSASTGTLSSANSGFDGEGDAILFFEGPTTSVRLDYTGGEQDNGVMYTFALNVNNPEPASHWMMLVAGLGVLAGVRKLKGRSRVSRAVR